MTRRGTFRRVEPVVPSPLEETRKMWDSAVRLTLLAKCGPLNLRHSHVSPAVVEENVTLCRKPERLVTVVGTEDKRKPSSEVPVRLLS